MHSNCNLKLSQPNIFYKYSLTKNNLYLRASLLKGTMPIYDVNVLRNWFRSYLINFFDQALQKCVIIWKNLSFNSPENKCVVNQFIWTF